MICNHEIWERETAVADGMCPICMAAKIERLREEVGKAQYERLEECEAEIERLRRDLDYTTTERETYNGYHQAACLEIERLRAERDETLATLRLWRAIAKVEE